MCYPDETISVTDKIVNTVEYHDSAPHPLHCTDTYLTGTWAAVPFKLIDLC